MGLTSSLQIGQSGLTAAQLGIQVTGNNISNAGTAGYSRQVVTLVPTQDGPDGNQYVGRGVQVLSVRRQVDTALQARLLTATSEDAQSSTDLQLMSNVNTILGGLTDGDLSSQLEDFFNAWSQLANSPTDQSTRSVVIQQGDQLATSIQTLRSNLVDQRAQIDTQTAATVQQADSLLSQIAGLNVQIVASQTQTASPNSLLDQRDALVSQLATYMDVTTTHQSSGALNVYVGSTPLVVAGASRGLQLVTQQANGETQISIATKDDGQTLTIASGQLGSLLSQRGGLIDSTVSRLDTLAGQIIYQVNRLHSQGSGTAPLTSATGTLSIPVGDRTIAIDDPTNATFANNAAGPAPTSGSFTITVTNTATGSSQSTLVPVDLDGLTNALTPGTANDTTVDDIRAAIAGAGNVSATYTADGRLQITAATGYQVSFSGDTSGVLATLGINTYFTGTDATNIAVRSDLEGSPGLLVAGGTDANGTPSTNSVALAISALRSTGVAGLGGASIEDHWSQTVQNVAVKAAGAKTNSDAASLVKQSITAQASAVSGVSSDEEAINLITYQQQYQASARFINTVNQLMQTLLAIAT